MASTLGIDIRKDWVFHFGGLIKNETPIELKEKDGIISFEVVLDEKTQLKIELFTVQKENDIIEGKYTLLNSGYNAKVDFTILKDGFLYRGIPEGMEQRSVWAFSAKK